jgi:hypothetical protein
MSQAADVAGNLPASAAYEPKMLAFDKLKGDLDPRFEVRTSSAGAPVVVLKGEKWDAPAAGGAGAADKGA